MKIIYFMGKSASGKDTIYRKVKEKLNPSPKEIILYTTRPIRDHKEIFSSIFFVIAYRSRRIQYDFLW